MGVVRGGRSGLWAPVLVVALAMVGCAGPGALGNGSPGSGASTPTPAASKLSLGLRSKESDELADAQEGAHPIKALLREIAGERFLRVRTVHTPSFHVVLTITAGPIPEEVRAAAEAAPIPVTIATHDGLPLDGFLAVVDRSWSEFAGTQGLASQDADPATQTIIFYFNPDSETNLNDFADAVTDHLNDERITVVAEQLEAAERLQR